MKLTIAGTAQLRDPGNSFGDLMISFAVSPFFHTSMQHSVQHNGKIVEIHSSLLAAVLL